MTTQAPEPTPAPAPEAPENDSAFQKLLKEKQNWAEKARKESEEKAALSAKLQEIETSRLKEKDDQKGLAEMYQKKYVELETKLKEQEAEQQRAIKLTQVKREWEKLGLKDAGQADKLLRLVDLEKIKYDPDLKITLGQEEEAKRIFEDFKPLFSGDAPRADHSAPKGAPASVSLDGYKQMLKDGSFKKMSREEQNSYVAKLYEAQGMTVKK
jgi:hypothetical protein